MQISNHATNRKAISPVLATVILIAITLIAAIAIAGFVFGLFGSFTSSARVSASVISCPATANPVCTLNLINTGTSNVQTTATCSMTYGGIGHASVLAVANTPIVAGGAALSVTCTATGLLPTAGSEVVGSVLLSNGATVQFAGIFQ